MMIFTHTHTHTHTTHNTKHTTHTQHLQTTLLVWKRTKRSTHLNWKWMVEKKISIQQQQWNESSISEREGKLFSGWTKQLNSSLQSNWSGCFSVQWFKQSMLRWNKIYGRLKIYSEWDHAKNTWIIVCTSFDCFSSSNYFDWNVFS
jgi:hypothetical protein